MLFKNATVLNKDFEFTTADVKVENGIITEIAPEIAGEGIDLSGKYILPGAVDIHTHGAVGHDHCSGDKEGLARVCEWEAKNGVTSFLPTTMTVGEDTIIKAVKAVREYMDEEHKGATPLGVHLEGPFFSMAKKGAQPAEYIKNPDFDMFKRIFDAGEGAVKIIDVAPELDGAVEFINEAKKYCVVSVGHTSGAYEDAMAAYAAGATNTVHLYNGMTGATHREPGIVGAAWDCESATAELICDGIHIHPAIIRTTFKILGKRVVMISDSLSCAGLPDGTVFYDAGGHEITVSGGKATLKDGTIAGSSTNLFECVRRNVKAGIPLETAMYAASYAPAKAIGEDKNVGSIDIGKRADLVITDKDLNIDSVYVKGVKM